MPETPGSLKIILISENVYDIVMEIACGLHNLRVTLRVPGHPKKSPEQVWH